MCTEVLLNRSLLASFFLLSACAKPPPEAPKELGELGAFLFANFEVDAEDDLALADYHEGIRNLRDYLTDDVDLTADNAANKDFAVTMPILKGDDLGDLAIPQGADPELQVNRAVPGLSQHKVDDSRVLHVEKNQICIESSSTIWAQREFLSDKDCWADGSCDRLETLTEVYKQNPLAKIWYDQFKDYRSFEVEDDEGELFTVIIGRAWIEEVAPAEGGGNNSWDQLFQIDVSIPDPKKSSQSLRWFSMWSSITLGGFPDDAYGNSVRDGISEAYDYADEFIDGVQESCKNDRAEAKPDRG